MKKKVSTGIRKRPSRKVAAFTKWTFWGIILAYVLMVIIFWVMSHFFWPRIGATVIEENGQKITVRYDADATKDGKPADTRLMNDNQYLNYAYGNTFTGDEITPSMLKSKNNVIKYDEDGTTPISVFIPPKARGFGPCDRKYLLHYAKKQWCVQPTVNAARYATVMSMLLTRQALVGLLLLFIVWQFASWVSRRPLKDKARTPGGSRPGKKRYRTKKPGRVSQWFRNRGQSGQTRRPKVRKLKQKRRRR